MKRAIFATGLIVLAFGLVAAYVFLREGGPFEDEPLRLRPGEPAVVAQGQAIYEAACASCHGADLSGQGDWKTRNPDGRLPAPPHDETGHTWHHPDEVLFEITKSGPAAIVGQGYESDMPGFGGQLSDEEIIAVLSYIKSRWPKEIQARHDSITAGR